jgi:hypothetical protein
MGAASGPMQVPGEGLADPSRAEGSGGHRLERIGQELRDDESGEASVVRGHYVPWGPLRRAPL